jgi:hypothetical protein
MGKVEEVKMDTQTIAQVEDYVYKKYKSFEGKELIIKDMGSHFQILKHRTGSPLILGKDILG